MASSCCRGPGLCLPQGLTVYFPSVREPPTVTRGGRASLGKVSFPAPWVCSDTETFQARVSPSPLSPGPFAPGRTGIFQCLLPQLLTLGELWDFVQLLPARAVRKALSRSERREEERRGGCSTACTPGKWLLRGRARNTTPHRHVLLAVSGTGEALDSCHGWPPKLISSGGRSLQALKQLLVHLTVMLSLPQHHLCGSRESPALLWYRQFIFSVHGQV